MENFENIQPTDSPIVLNREVKDYLIETSKWGKFLAIVGYVGMGFIMLVGLVMMVGLSAFNSMASTGFPLGLFGIIYIIIGVVYYFPVTYLYRFSDAIRRGITTNNNESVSTGFENLKSLFKFMGIMTIVVLSLYVLIIVIAIPVAIFASR